jgi:D-alanyl-D-alanine carboxypeptidase (penicillin-binding protein 5/6)
MWQAIQRWGCIALALILFATPSVSVDAATKKTTKKSASAKRTTKKTSAKKLSAKKSSKSAKKTSAKKSSKASASRKSAAKKVSARPAATKPAEPPKPPYQAYIVVEATTGKVVAEQNADKPWPPASLAKMMLTLIVMEEVEQGKVTWKTPVKTSVNASRVGGSQVYLEPGETHPLETMMRAVEIASANDAATAVAEAVAGSAAAMVERMNARARELGMKQTRFVNVHGLPPERGKPDNVTSARDMATLGRTLVTKHSKVLEWSSKVRAPFRDGKFQLYSTNHAFLEGFQGADGLKTGFHAGAMFNLVATAERNDTRLLAVMLGSPSLATRYAETSRLLEDAFMKTERRVVLKAGEVMPELFYVEGSEHQYVPLQAGDDLVVFAEKSAFSRVRVRLDETPRLAAPLGPGFPAGQIVATLDGRVVASVPAVVSQLVPKASLLWRVWNWRTPVPTVEEFLAVRSAGIRPVARFWER